jgi:hypothetical protein
MVRTDLYFDAENQVIGIRCIDENGAVIDTLPELRLDLEDLQYATEMLAFMRRVHFTDANDATKKRCYGLFTKSEDDETDDGHSSETEDLHMGGGGAMLCKITTLYATAEFTCDYFEVQRWDGSATIGSPFKVAKSFASRMKTAYGTCSYEYTDDNTRVSTDSSDSSTEDQVLTPPFYVGQLLFVQAADYTMVTPSGESELKFTEQATEREWTAPEVVA